jgi:hypothetical protein
MALSSLKSIQLENFINLLKINILQFFFNKKKLDPKIKLKYYK